jgi:hypothetical protein
MVGGRNNETDEKEENVDDLVLSDGTDGGCTITKDTTDDVGCSKSSSCRNRMDEDSVIHHDGTVLAVVPVLIIVNTVVPYR